MEAGAGFGSVVVEGAATFAERKATLRKAMMLDLAVA